MGSSFTDISRAELVLDKCVDGPHRQDCSTEQTFCFDTQRSLERGNSQEDQGRAPRQARWLSGEPRVRTVDGNSRFSFRSFGFESVLLHTMMLELHDPRTAIGEPSVSDIAKSSRAFLAPGAEELKGRRQGNSA